MSEKDFDPSLGKEVVKFSNEFAGDNGFILKRQAQGNSLIDLTLGSEDVTIHVRENRQLRRLHIDAFGVPTSQSIKLANKYIAAVDEIHL